MSVAMSVHSGPADVAEGKTVKELEAKIKNLESENMKLLNKVHNPVHPRCTNPKIPDAELDEDNLENSVLDLNELLNDNIAQREDEWENLAKFRRLPDKSGGLYVSPQLPPTPIHKKITPHQWLSEGHHRGEGDKNLLSLDDVRKNLVQDIDEAEDMNEIFNHGAEMIQQTINSGGVQREGRGRGRRGRGGGLKREAEAVPMVSNWKAKVPPEDEVEEEVVPQRKWKVKQVSSVAPASQIVLGDPVNHESTGTEESSMLPGKQMKPARSGESDVPVVKWKAKMPSDAAAPSRKVISPEDADVPVVKWKAKIPSDAAAPSRKVISPEDADVPVLKRKAKMPSDVAAPSRKVISPEDADVPVVKWKAKMPSDAAEPSRKVISPEDTDVPVLKRKAKMPSDAAAPNRKVISPEDADVPVLKWKAKMPTDTSTSRKKAVSPEDSDVPVAKWKAKMATDTANSRRKAVSPEDSNFPEVKGKAKMPIDHSIEENSDSHHSPNLALKSQGGQLQRSLPKNVRNVRSQAKVPNSSAHTTSNGMTSDATHSVCDNNTRISRYASHHQDNSPLSSLVSSPGQHPPGDDTSHKSLSRRSSFSDSRSPSPPSISPQVRMAIASPVSRRRTPSPARRKRQSPSPVHQRKQIQLLSMNHQLIPGSRSSPGIPSPGNKLRSPRSHHASGSPAGGGLVKGGSPISGLGSSNDRKQKRMLPSPPPSAVISTARLREGKSAEKTRKKVLTPGLVAKRPIHEVSPGRDAAGDDDESWLEGCF